VAKQRLSLHLIKLAFNFLIFSILIFGGVHEVTILPLFHLQVAFKG